MTVQAMKRVRYGPMSHHLMCIEQWQASVTEDNRHLLSEADLDGVARGHRRNMTTRHQKPPEYPIGTIAMYGPDDKTTTKIAAAVFLTKDSRSIIRRWVATDVTTNPKVQAEIEAFFKEYGVTSVAMSDGNMGCPHEEGQDFPHGEDCPFCPFWKGKQGSNRKE